MVRPTDFDDPRETLVALLEDNWNAANTPSVGTPNFATAWLTNVDKARPLVTVTNREDTPKAAVGYTSIRGDGSGVSQRKRGFVFLNCWSDDRAPDEVSEKANPKQQAKEMWHECDRIILANAVGTGDLEALRTDGPMSDEESTSSGVLWRLHGRIEYEYELTPV
jgi:hypothetical protein